MLSINNIGKLSWFIFEPGILYEFVARGYVRIYHTYYCKNKQTCQCYLIKTDIETTKKLCTLSSLLASGNVQAEKHGR